MSEYSFHFFLHPGEYEFKITQCYYRVAECNNALIYPGLSFGAILSQSRCVTDTMLLAGAKKLTELSPAITHAAEHTSGREAEAAGSVSQEYEYGGESLLPDFGDAPRVNFEVAVAVAVQAVQEGSACSIWASGLTKELSEGGIEKVVREKAGEMVWVPVYYEYEYDEQGLKDV